MSSYDQPQEYISVEEFRESMRLVRLQIAIPISVLFSLGTNIVCALALKPGLGAIADLYPTLLTPNKSLVGVYVTVIFALEIGCCLLLTVARSPETKDTFVKGVGIRFAAANWIMAAWAVCWTLQWFNGAGVLLLINLVIVLSMHLTLLRCPPSFAHPLNLFFIHAPVSLLLPLLLNLSLSNGFVALKWVINSDSKWDKWLWPAVISLLSVHSVSAIWEVMSLQYLLALGNEYLLIALLLFSPRTDPKLPASARPKPPPLVFTLIGCMILHPLAIGLGLMWTRSRNRRGRIRLEEDAVAAEDEDVIDPPVAVQPRG